MLASDGRCPIIWKGPPSTPPAHSHSASEDLFSCLLFNMNSQLWVSDHLKKAWKMKVRERNPPTGRKQGRRGEQEEPSKRRPKSPPRKRRCCIYKTRTGRCERHLGSRGSARKRIVESSAAREVLGVGVRGERPERPEEGEQERRDQKVRGDSTKYNF